MAALTRLDVATGGKGHLGTMPAAQTASGARDHLPTLLAEAADGFVDWPIRDEDGRVAWDWPERIPQYLQRAAVRELNRARNAGTPYHNDYLVL